VIVLSLAAAAGLFAMSIPLVRALYERGSFEPADTLATAATVVLFAIGVPMWGVQQILARGFYAREEMWAPVVIGTAATVAAVPIYWALNDSMGIEGLALASSLAITLYTIGLAIVWYRRTGTRELWPVAKTLAGNLPLAAVGGGAAWLVSRWVLDTLGMDGFVNNAVAVAIGGVVLLGVALLPRPVRRDLVGRPAARLQPPASTEEGPLSDL
jgi:putative peptidoglycan lipid II flippase